MRRKRNEVIITAKIFNKNTEKIKDKKYIVGILTRLETQNSHGLSGLLDLLQQETESRTLKGYRTPRSYRLEYLGITPENIAKTRKSINF